MRFKLIYLYIILGLGVITTIIILSAKNSNPHTPDTNLSSEQMPNDNVHKGLQNPTKEDPSKSNVSPEVYHHLDVLKKDADANPQDTAKTRAYADFLTAAHKQDEALPYYEKIIKKDPKRNDILFDLAMIYYNQHNLDKAEDYTNRILLNDKNNTQAMYNLGAIAAGKGEKDRAREIWNKIINNFPSDEVAQLARSSLEKL